jgi:hypothetical protein
MANGIQKSALQRLVNDTIVSFPEDCHKRIELFFEHDATPAKEEAGIFIGSLDNVRRSWARALGKAQSFRHREIKDTSNNKKNSIIDSPSFTIDFINDLSLDFNDHLRQAASHARAVAAAERNISTAAASPIIDEYVTYSTLASLVRSRAALVELQSLCFAAPPRLPARRAHRVSAPRS